MESHLVIDHVKSQDAYSVLLVLPAARAEPDVVAGGDAGERLAHGVGGLGHHDVSLLLGNVVVADDLNRHEVVRPLILIFRHCYIAITKNLM